MEHYNGFGELLFGLGVVVLGLALAWAVIRNRHRNRANDAIGEKAARDQREHPQSYDLEKYRSQLEPDS